MGRRNFYIDLGGLYCYTKNMNLSGRVNIGKVMEERLKKVGINDLDTLLRLGSKEAFLRLLSSESDTCLCSLYGLEGAICGIRWHNLSPDVKEDLKNFFNKSIRR